MMLIADKTLAGLYSEQRKGRLLLDLQYHLVIEDIVGRGLLVTLVGTVPKYALLYRGER